MVANLRINPPARACSCLILRRFSRKANSRMGQTAALVFSIAIEAVIGFTLIRMLGWGSGLNAAFAAAIGTLITHPIAWVLIPRLVTALGYAGAVALVEAGVVLAESIAYRLIVKLSWRRSLIASLVANTASTAAGLLYYALFT
jgi:hypothetical protein